MNGKPIPMNAYRFALFGAAYLDGLTAAVAANPEDYGYGPEGVPAVVARMLAAIASGGPGSVNLDGGGFRRACKALGIKHTRKAIVEYLTTDPPDPVTYLSSSEGTFRVIHRGNAIGRNVPTAEEAIRAARHFKLTIDPRMWDGDAGTWVLVPVEILRLAAVQ